MENALHSTIALIYLIVVGAGIGLLLTEENFFRIKLSAHRIGLRDKGKIESDGDGNVTIHRLCNTRVRIGVLKSKKSVSYCWRCEAIFEDGDTDSEDPPPSKDHSDPEEFDGNVIRLVSNSRK